MVLTASQQDKTLKNSVDLYYLIHQEHRKEVQRAIKASIEKEKQLDAQKQKGAGRPKHYSEQLPASLQKDISLNTAAYSKARSRLSTQMVEALLQATRIKEAHNSYTHWYGYRVLMADGTYIKMQDTPALREKYQVKGKGKSQSSGCPEGLLETIIERGTGQIHSFRLSSRHISELALLYQMLDQLPAKSLLLLDRLYNCYEIIAKCNRLAIQWVMPARRKRKYQLVQVLGPGDEIIAIQVPKKRSSWLESNECANCLLVRRIECQSANGKKYLIETSLLDKTIGRNEIQALYLTRWDIEVSIREVKTIMDIDILRSGTPQMVLKELTVSLATYNLIRKIIYASIKNLPFPP